MKTLGEKASEKKPLVDNYKWKLTCPGEIKKKNDGETKNYLAKLLYNSSTHTALPLCHSLLTLISSNLSSDVIRAGKRG